MKCFKKIVSIVLALSIIAIFAGCSINSRERDRKSHKKDRDEDSVVTSEEDKYSSDDYDFEADVTTTPLVDLPFDEAFALAKSDALDYIGFAHYSREGLSRQLSSPYTHHYPEDVVEAAISSIEEEGLVDWNQEAFELALSLIDSGAYSYQSLINEMTYFHNGIGFAFTLEEATNAVNRLEDEGLVDWNEEAVEAAQSYLIYGDREFTRDLMIEQLTYTGVMGDCFTLEQATYAVDELGL